VETVNKVKRGKGEAAPLIDSDKLRRQRIITTARTEAHGEPCSRASRPHASRRDDCFDGELIRC
jgi:hypothetical protein